MLFRSIGDISDREEKLAYLAGEQATYVAKLIPCIQQKKAYPKEYARHSNPAIFLSLGRNNGIGQLPNKSGTVIGSYELVKETDVSVGHACSLSRKFHRQTHEIEGYDGGSFPIGYEL